MTISRIAVAADPHSENHLVLRQGKDLAANIGATLITIDIAAPIQEIRALIRTNDIDLVMLAAGSSEKTKMLLRSKALCPVLVIQANSVQPYKDIAIITDFSEAAERAASSALDLATTDSNTSVFTCYEPRHYVGPVIDFDGDMDDLYPLTRHWNWLTKEAFPQLVTQLSSSTAPPTKLIPYFRMGKFQSQLDWYIEHVKPDVITIGAVGQNEPSGKHLGSTTARLISSVKCDILISP